MSVVKTVGTGVAWNTAAIALGKILMFVNVFLILTHLSVYEYGFTELVMSIIAIVGVVLLPGLVNTIVADLSVEKGKGNKEGMNRVFHQHFYLNVVLGVGAWVTLFFFSGPVAALAGNEYAAQFIKIASFSFLIAPLRMTTQILSTVMLRFFDQSFYGVIEELFKFICLVILVVWMQAGIHGLIYSIVLSQLAVVLVFAPRTISAYRYFSNSPAKDSARFWNILRAHRKWSIGSSYVGTVAQNARLWIIKFMLGTEAVGLFAFAFGMFSHIVSLMPLTAVLAPVIPRYIDKREQLVRILRASIKFQFVVGVVFLFVALAMSYIFVHVFFPKYVAAVPVLYVILLSILSNSVVSLFTPVFAAFKEQQSMLFSNLFKLVLTVTILPVAVASFGFIGIGVEIVLTGFGNGVERYIRIRRLIPEFRLSPQALLTHDAYEKEAMQTIKRGVLNRLPRIWPLTRI